MTHHFDRKHTFLGFQIHHLKFNPGDHHIRLSRNKRHLALLMTTNLRQWCLPFGIDVASTGDRLFHTIWLKLLCFSFTFSYYNEANMSLPTYTATATPEDYAAFDYDDDDDDD
jgi:hypothetical protein